MKIKEMIAGAVILATLGFEVPAGAQESVRFEPAVASSATKVEYVDVARRRRHRRHHRRVVVRRRSRGKSMAIVGGSAAGGAAIGALAGGGKGAAIGAIAGGAGGYVYDRSTHKKVRRY